MLLVVISAVNNATQGSNTNRLLIIGYNCNQSQYYSLQVMESIGKAIRLA